MLILFNVASLSVPKKQPKRVAKIYITSRQYICNDNPKRKIHLGARGDSLFRSNSLCHQNFLNEQPSTIRPPQASLCSRSLSIFNWINTCISTMMLIVGTYEKPQVYMMDRRIVSIDRHFLKNFKTKENFNSSTTLFISISVNTKPYSPSILTRKCIGSLNVFWFIKEETTFAYDMQQPSEPIKEAPTNTIAIGGEATTEHPPKWVEPHINYVRELTHKWIKYKIARNCHYFSSNVSTLTQDKSLELYLWLLIEEPLMKSTTLSWPSHSSCKNFSLVTWWSIL